MKISKSKYRRNPIKNIISNNHNYTKNDKIHNELLELFTVYYISNCEW